MWWDVFTGFLPSLLWSCRFQLQVLPPYAELCNWVSFYLTTFCCPSQVSTISVMLLMLVLLRTVKSAGDRHLQPHVLLSLYLLSAKNPLWWACPTGQILPWCPPVFCFCCHLLGNQWLHLRHPWQHAWNCSAQPNNVSYYLEMGQICQVQTLESLLPPSKSSNHIERNSREKKKKTRNHWDENQCEWESMFVCFLLILLKLHFSMCAFCHSLRDLQLWL